MLLMAGVVAAAAHVRYTWAKFRADSRARFQNDFTQVTAVCPRDFKTNLLKQLYWLKEKKTSDLGRIYIEACLCLVLNKVLILLMIECNIGEHPHM